MLLVFKLKNYVDFKKKKKKLLTNAVAGAIMAL